MTHPVARKAILLSLTLCLMAALPRCLAQETARQSGGVLIEFPNFGPIPGSPEPSLGPGPGALDPSMLAPETGLIGGRRRAGRIPRPNKARQMTTESALAQRPAMSLPAPLPEHATTRSLASPSIVEDEGTPEGLTLEAAIEQMLAANLDILALK
ncbi:MAG TPA: hypothetical protein VJY33_14825, partial [Isosphaeraceae bacterium]|nr:hypothetical protein [Isosphaeraceae bacterium]